MRTRSRCVPILLSLALLVVFTSSVQAQRRGNPNPGIAPIGSIVGDRTYGQWAAAWWQWIATTPVHNDSGDVVHPFLDPTGAFTGLYQSGEVFFLVGGTGDSDVPSTRTVAIPPGKKLFFPLLNWMYANFPTDPWATPEQLFEYIGTPSADRIHNLHAEIDGKSLVGLKSYFAVSPEFVVDTLPADNFWGLDITQVPYFSQCMTSGYWIMLNPLSPGNHTLSFGGEVMSASDPSEVEFRIDRIYQVTVNRH